MARKASPARLVIALSVAGVLAVFLLYTSIAGGGNPSLPPSELAGRTGDVQLAGLVVEKAGAEISRNAVVEAWVGQVEREQVLPVDPCPHCLGGLPVGQALARLHQRDRR